MKTTKHLVLLTLHIQKMKRKPVNLTNLRLQISKFIQTQKTGQLYYFSLNNMFVQFTISKSTFIKKNEFCINVLNSSKYGDTKFLLVVSSNREILEKIVLTHKFFN